MNTALHHLGAAAAPNAGTLAQHAAATAGQSVTFWLLAVLSVVAALGMIAARKAVHCAMLLAVVMLSLAVLYATQGAPFLAFVQVIVYTGAVLMLFLFVVMLVGVSSAESVVETIRGQRLAAGLAGIAMIVLLLGAVGHAALGGITKVGASYGSANLTAVARLVFTKYVYAFEVTSALLITAALGAMVLAHRERTTPKPTQRDLSQIITGRRRVSGASRVSGAIGASDTTDQRAVGERAADRRAAAGDRAAGDRTAGDRTADKQAADRQADGGDGEATT